MTVIAMSRTEIDRMSVLHDLADGRIRIAEASALMGLGRRQVFRLAKAFSQHGPQALVSRRRGRPSNRCYPTALRAEVIGIIRERYADFGPTLAAEKLAELHGIVLARETVRQWMIGAGSVEGSPRPVEACAPAAVSPGLRGRVGPDRRIGALVVRGPRSAMHPARLH
jgi:hypothetical protein